MTYELGAILGIGLLLVGNLIMVAYYGGRLTQKVDDHERRITGLEGGWRHGIRAKAHSSEL